MNAEPATEPSVASEKPISASVDSNPTTRQNSDAEGQDSQESEISARSIAALTGSALSYFVTVGFMNAYGVFQQYYTARYLPEYSNFQISWIGSFATFILFACAAPAGFLADKYGPTIPITCGAILQLIAIFMISLSTKYYQFFLAQAVALGIGQSFVAIPTSTIVPLYFKRNRGLAQGVSIGGSSLGGILWPVALDQLLNRDKISFGWSMRIIGFVMMPILVATILCLRRPSDAPSQKSAERTEKSADNVEATAQSEPPKKKKDLSALKTPAYIFLCLGLAFAYFGFFCPLYYVSVYATTLGFSENLAFYMVSILNGASLFGRILPGIIADKYGAFNMLTFSAFGSALVVFCWTAATSIPGLVVWTAFYGFISGAIMSLQLACATLLAPEELRGAAMGLAFGSVSLTGLFGTPIAGQLVEHGFVALSCFAGAMLIVGGVFLTLSRLSVDRRLFARV